MTRPLKLLLVASSLWYFSEGLLGPLFAVFSEQVGGDVLDITAAWATYLIVSGLAYPVVGKLLNRSRWKFRMIAVGYGLNTLFWCAGCQGAIYPMDGQVPYHVGGVRSAALLSQRLTAKMHRELLAWGWHGTPGLCGPYLEPIMDKTAYKTQLTYPTPTTDKIDGKCCQPFGRTTVLWGAGKEFPVRGEDFAFMLFRKRNCCVGY